jgi:transcriptional regulator of heat shock response
VYYTFVNDADTLISCVYVKVNLDGYDAVIAIVGPLRVNYKKNIAILKKVLESL